MHTGANQTNYISSSGNFVGTEPLPVATTTPSWFLLARVEVVAPAAAGAIVAFGDSITDGIALDAEHEQPVAGPAREAAGQARAAPKLAVLNAGIAGNRVLRRRRRAERAGALRS